LGDFLRKNAPNAKNYRPNGEIPHNLVTLCVTLALTKNDFWWEKATKRFTS
jgi:hypothetical protein